MSEEIVLECTVSGIISQKQRRPFKVVAIYYSPNSGTQAFLDRVDAVFFKKNPKVKN